MGFFKDTGILSDDDVMEIDGDSLAELASKINKGDTFFNTTPKKNVEKVEDEEDSSKEDEETETDEVETTEKEETKEEAVETKNVTQKPAQSEKETKEEITEKKKETRTRTHKATKEPTNFDKFFIPEGVEVTGDIKVSGEALICGDYSGTITASQNVFVDTKEIVKFTIKTFSDVLIDENTVFVGNIECKNAAIKGKVKGNIHTEDMLYVANNALVVGDVTTKRLNVEDSGRIVGGVHLDTGDTNIDTKEIFGE